MRPRERGAALLLVLAAVALMTILAVDIAARASTEALRVTRGARDASIRRAFDSGSEVARGMIVELDRGEFTFWGQGWNQEVRFSLCPGQQTVTRISDESGKVNIGRASSQSNRKLLADSISRLFGYLVRHGKEEGTDWKDLENKVLRRLELPRPLFTLDGLREVGIEPARIFGVRGLSRYLTCFGDGRINLNTAPKPVLASLDPEFDDAMVERIAAYRGRTELEPGIYSPFRDPADLMLVEGILNRSVGVDGQHFIARNLYTKVQGLITITSSVFSARIEVTESGRSREAWAFVLPNGSPVALEEIQP